MIGFDREKSLNYLLKREDIMNVSKAVELIKEALELLETPEKDKKETAKETTKKEVKKETAKKGKEFIIEVEDFGELNVYDQDLDTLKEIAEGIGLKPSKRKISAEELAEEIVNYLENQDEEDTEVDFAHGMSDEELKEALKNAGLSIRGKRQALADKYNDAIKEGLIVLKEDEEEEEEFEVSEERALAEDEVEKSELKLIKTKKTKISAMRDFVEPYVDDIDDLDDSEVQEEYINIKKAFVDDEGEIHEESDPYIRNGVDYCCGVELEVVDGVATCGICGEAYEE